MSQAKEPLCLLVTRSGVDLLGKEISDLGQRLTELEKEAVLRRFPDASLFIQGWDNIDRYEEVVHTQTSVPTGFLAQDVHRALGAFPRCWYSVEFPRDYYESLMPVHFVAGPRQKDPRKEEFDIDNLCITVGFHRRPKRAVVERFGAVVHAWYASVRDKGIFGDGPVARISPALRWQGRRVDFHIDARASGQNTLEWLILNCVEFGIQVFPIHRVGFNGPEQLLEHYIGPAKGKSKEIAIALSSGPAGASEKEADWRESPLPAGLPSDCVPFTELESKLRIFVCPYYEWDALTVTVYFTACPTPRDQAAFRKLIESWGFIGYYGGLGGTGIHRLGDIDFDSDSESAVFYADMGDADNPGALALLIRLLESFSKDLAIDALVLGESLASR